MAYPIGKKFAEFPLTPIPSALANLNPKPFDNSYHNDEQPCLSWQWPHPKDVPGLVFGAILSVWCVTSSSERKVVRYLIDYSATQDGTDNILLADTTSQGVACYIVREFLKANPGANTEEVLKGGN